MLVGGIWLWVAKLVPISAPLLYENSGEFAAEHPLVEEYLSQGVLWVCSGPSFILL